MCAVSSQKLTYVTRVTAEHAQVFPNNAYAPPFSLSSIPRGTHKLRDMSAAAAALIWWIVPAVGLIGALGYAVWVSKFKRKYENDVLRSTDAFTKFQNTFRK
jgi:hypothetical protein